MQVLFIICYFWDNNLIESANVFIKNISLCITLKKETFNFLYIFVV